MFVPAGCGAKMSAGLAIGAVTVCTPAVLPGSSPLLKGHPLERRARATRLVLGARNLALLVAPEQNLLAVMTDRLTLYDAAGADASPERAVL